MSAAPAPVPERDDGVPMEITDAPSLVIPVALPAAFLPYARSSLRWRLGCEVTVLRDGGEVYPAMLAALAAARRSICFETYIFESDATGHKFLEVLAERAHAGVDVRVIYDAVGSFAMDAKFVEEMRAAGIQILEFNPIAPWRRRFRLSHRDHRKIIVVDDEIGFTGGLNIGNEYAPVSAGGGGWHDMHCRVRGKIVHDLAHMFRRTWIRAGGKPYRSIPKSVEVSSTGAAFVRLLDNGRIRTRATVRRAYLHVIRAAQKSILIENAYFLPDRGIRRALAGAVRRGVDVRVVVPGRSDIKLIEWASLYVMRRLAKAGVKMLRWRGVMLHAKTATIDDAWATIGSYNFDAMSRFNNLEVTVEILDTDIATVLRNHFEIDAMNCDPFDEQTWLSMAWWRKALAWLGFRFRRFL